MRAIRGDLQRARQASLVDHHYLVSFPEDCSHSAEKDARKGVRVAWSNEFIMGMPGSQSIDTGRQAHYKGAR
jgi:hypothetical protein